MKRMICWGLVLLLGGALAAVPAVAADKSDLASRAATWEKEYNAGNLAAVVGSMPPMAAACRPIKK